MGFSNCFFVGMNILFLKKEQQLTTPMKKVDCHLDLEVSMLLGDIQMEKKGVLPVNYVKQCVQLRP